VRERLRRLSPGWRVVIVFFVANAVGALVVNTYLAMTGQNSIGDVQDDVHDGLMLLLAYFAVSGFVLAIAVGRRLRALDWLGEDRSPTEAERRDTLLLPRSFAALTMVAWIGGATLFAIAGHIGGDDWRHVIRSFTGSMLGGLTTASMTYLIIDRVLRSVFAQVLATGPTPVRTVGVRWRIALAWWLGSGVPLLGVALSPIFPNQTATDLAVLGGIGIVSGSAMIAIASRSVSDRLATVREALAQVQRGDLNVDVPVDEAGEIGQLQAGVNAMVHGLRERTVIADLFGRHVGTEVARRALAEGVHLGGEQRDVSALFLDVTGSTTLAATRAPTDVLAMLNELFGTVVRVVEEEGGWVDKFEGDAVLCVFGAPVPLHDHPTRALATARRLAALVGRLDFGIGVSSGLVVAGNIGSETRFEYTVIGDPVNEASRLTEAAKARPARVLAACRTMERASREEAACWQPAETLQLRGRPEPTETCEPVRVPSVPPTLIRPKGA
jgi:adenylate cyclase